MKFEIETLDQMHELWLDYVDDIQHIIAVQKLANPSDEIHRVLNLVSIAVSSLPYGSDTTYFIEYDDEE